MAIENSISGGDRVELPGALLFAPAQVETPDRKPIPAGAFRIAGVVVNAKAASPLARCRVTITDAKNAGQRAEYVTGDDGHFEFHVPAGKYSLGGAKRGFISAGYNQHEQFSTAIVTGADLDTESLILRLAPNAVLCREVPR